ncbi:hypothetical protein DPMN_189475 [Dreissena polymorpha]|uniref:Uncharacterized protein n=1 Tax=Dreissena polymorpha TaxID=45954 RepID=A0A9D4IB22_DREPO|nr:hypothetical protein DPMN_189475 [Dreissena polymorpha]
MDLTFPKLPCWPPGPQGQCRTFHKQQGSSHSYMASTRFTCRIRPDMNRVDLASVWDWG